MGSTFKGLDLFGSGPHVFEIGREGRRVVSLSAIAGDPSVAGTIESGDYELRVAVKGRLVAESESALWALRDAISDEAAYQVAGGDLIDHHGRIWDDVKLFQVEWDGGIDRGRVLSIGYEALFGITN